MNVFDIIGPIMIGPSSSHTAGAARIGRIARLLLGSEPNHAKITLYGSFAQTWRGHGTDKALIAGIMGMYPDDTRIRNSVELAKKANISIEIAEGELQDSHPNTVEILLRDSNGREICVQGSSVGGGNIQITKIDGMEVAFSGEYTTLIVLHRDLPGVIAEVTEKIREQYANISNFRLSRKQKGGIAIMTIEMDGKTNSGIVASIETLPNVLRCTFLQAV